jgi:hypothetical protein
MGNMNRLVLFAALLIGAAFFTQNGIGELPERVAVHFDRNGAANGWISRDDYRIYILGALIGVIRGRPAMSQILKDEDKYPILSIGLQGSGGAPPKAFC